MEPLLKSKTRNKLVKAQKYVFIDLGIRRIAAGEGIHLPEKYIGHLFEQFVGLELIRYANLSMTRTKIKYWRDADGPEVDWVIGSPDLLTPIEVKLTDTPHISDTRHLKTFLSEYDNTENGYVICQVPRKQKLAENIYAVPWQDIIGLFN